MPLILGLWALWRFFSRVVRTGWHKEEIRGLIIITISTIFLGAWFYRAFEPTIITWTDAFYFTVMTLTTVGYGDFSPTTMLTKWFTIFYVFIGLGIIGGFVGLIGETVVEDMQEQIDSGKERIQKRKNGKQ